MDFGHTKGYYKPPPPYKTYENKIVLFNPVRFFRGLSFWRKVDTDIQEDSPRTDTVRIRPGGETAGRFDRRLGRLGPGIFGRLD
jgi:hypothetical protein